MPKIVNLASFQKPEACGQTVLPDKSVLIGQKLVENAKIRKFKCATFWVVFRQLKNYCQTRRKEDKDVEVCNFKNYL